MYPQVWSEDHEERQPPTMYLPVNKAGTVQATKITGDAKSRGWCRLCEACLKLQLFGEGGYFKQKNTELGTNEYLLR